MIETYARVVHDGLELQEVVYRGDSHQGRHAHPELSISLMLAGGLTERISGRDEYRVSSLAVGIKPPGVEHANQFARSGARILSLKITESWLPRQVGEINERVWGWAPAGPALQPLVRLLRRFRSAPDLAADWLEPSVIDVLSAVDTDPRIAQSAEAPGYLKRVRERLLDTFDRGVQARAIADDAGLHPATLARAFRRHFRESMSDCVRRRRMQVAASLLRRPELSLTDIAGLVGLADQSHLTRLCREECGEPPAAFRRVITGHDRSRPVPHRRRNLGV